MVDVEVVMSLVSFVLLLWSENTFGRITEKNVSGSPSRIPEQYSRRSEGFVDLHRRNGV
jgi:hypothetical protein